MGNGSSSTIDVAPAALGESLRALRLADEVAVTRMADSLMRHGQITAVSAFAAARDQLEVIDGFKRAAAARRLGWEVVRVDVLYVDVTTAKAALFMLNQGSALSELEQAWLCRSLYREDRLTQPQIGQLLRRHKSWVCRLIALAEGLDETVEADVRLGLLAARAAYEVTRLPRGNQREVAEIVARRGLTVAQTARLVTQLVALPDEAARRARLRELDAAPATPPAMPAPTPPRTRTPAEELIGAVDAMTRLCVRVEASLLRAPLAALGAPASAHVLDALVKLEPALIALTRTITHARGGSRAEME